MLWTPNAPTGAGAHHAAQRAARRASQLAVPAQARSTARDTSKCSFRGICKDSHTGSSRASCTSRYPAAKCFGFPRLKFPVSGDSLSGTRGTDQPIHYPTNSPTGSSHGRRIFSERLRMKKVWRRVRLPSLRPGRCTQRDNSSNVQLSTFLYVADLSFHKKNSC